MKFKVTEDGFTWLVLENDLAEFIFKAESLSLYDLRSDNSESMIENEEDLKNAIKYGHQIGIEAGFNFKRSKSDIKMTLDSYTHDGPNAYLRFDVEGARYISSAKILGNKVYALGDTFRVFSVGHDGVSSYNRSYEAPYDGESFQSSLQKFDIEIMLREHISEEIRNRFKPEYVYQESWMDEEDYDDAVKEVAKGILYANIITDISSETGIDFEEIDGYLTVSEYDSIILEFCSKIINHTAHKL